MTTERSVNHAHGVLTHIEENAKLKSQLLSSVSEKARLRQELANAQQDRLNYYRERERALAALAESGGVILPESEEVADGIRLLALSRDHAAAEARLFDQAMHLAGGVIGLAADFAQGCNRGELRHYYVLTTECEGLGPVTITLQRASAESPAQHLAQLLVLVRYEAGELTESLAARTLGLDIVTFRERRQEWQEKAAQAVKLWREQNPPQMPDAAAKPA